MIIARKITCPFPWLRLRRELRVEADSERLATVFNHLLQNAQEGHRSARQRYRATAERR